MKLSIGYSSCPNDTFIFDALIHKRIDTEGIDFEPYIADVEDLNKKAFVGELDITKLSYHAYAYVSDKYQLLNAGSALGNNCGPLLISKEEVSDLQEAIKEYKVAIPGKYTTANFLLGIAFPEVGERKASLFSAIEGDVLEEKVDAGLIIHENRFTYQQKGLKKLIDLGEYWETKTGMPIPLGGIAIKRELPQELKEKVDRLLRASVEYAFANPSASKDYVKSLAQEMDDAVVRQHIELYVNDYSIDLGDKGKEAVNKLYEIAESNGIIPALTHPIFV